MRTPALLSALLLTALGSPVRADGLTITHDIATSLHGEVNATNEIVGGEHLYIRYSVSGLKVVDARIGLEPKITITAASGDSVTSGTVANFKHFHAFFGGTFSDHLRIELPTPLANGKYTYTVSVTDLKSTATGTATGHFTLTNHTLALRNLRFTSAEDAGSMELVPVLGVGDFVYLQFRITGLDAGARIGTAGPMRLVFGCQIVDEKDVVVFENPAFATVEVPVDALPAGAPGNCQVKCSRPGRHVIKLSFTLTRAGVSIQGGAQRAFVVHPRGGAPDPK